MKNVYLVSLNPMHYSHLHTWVEAQKKLNEKLFLCICQNMLKTTGLYNIEERAEIACKYYNIPSKQIVLLFDKNQIVNTIKNAQVIVRGIREEKDLLEIIKLCEHYNIDLSNNAQKLLSIEVPKEMKEISSSNLIARIKSSTYMLEDNWIPEKLFFLIKEKIHKK